MNQYPKEQRQVFLRNLIQHQSELQHKVQGNIENGKQSLFEIIDEARTQRSRTKFRSSMMKYGSTQNSPRDALQPMPVILPKHSQIDQDRSKSVNRFYANRNPGFTQDQEPSQTNRAPKSDISAGETPNSLSSKTKTGMGMKLSAAVEENLRRIKASKYVPSIVTTDPYEGEGHLNMKAKQYLDRVTNVKKKLPTLDVNLGYARNMTSMSGFQTIPAKTRSRFHGRHTSLGIQHEGPQGEQHLPDFKTPVHHRRQQSDLRGAPELRATPLYNRLVNHQNDQSPRNNWPEHMGHQYQQQQDLVVLPKIIKVKGSEDLQMMRSHQDLMILQQNFQNLNTVYAQVGGQVIEANFEMDMNTQEVWAQSNKTQVRELIQSSQLDNMNKKQEKIVFNDYQQVVGYRHELTDVERWALLDKEREARQRERIRKNNERRGECALLGIEFDGLPDDEIDGFSSASSIDSQKVLRKVAQYQEQQLIQVEEKNTFQESIKIHPALEKYKKQQYLDIFSKTKADEMARLQHVDEYEETKAIFLKVAKEQLGLTGQKLSDEEIAQILKSFGGASINKSNMDAQLVKKLEGSSLLTQYMNKIGAHGYDPDEFDKQKKDYLQKQAQGKGIFGDGKTGFDDYSMRGTKVSGINARASMVNPQQKFLDKLRMQQLLKYANDPGTADMLANDPRFKFMQTQIKNGEMPMNLLNSILNKVLLIHDKTLSIGVLNALSESCKNFHDFVSKIILDNNKMKDADFAKLLKNLSMLKSFRGIVYKRNELGDESLVHINQIMKKRIPNHLEELRIESCSVSMYVIEDLMQILNHTTNFLKKLGLVNANLSQPAFKLLLRFIKKGAMNLTELDLANNSIIRGAPAVKLMRILSKNNKLIDVNLSHNELFRPSRSKKERLRGDLSEEEAKILRYIIIMIKDNADLVHLNLTNCGIPEFGTLDIIERMQKSKSLQCVHFCGNPGAASKTMIDYLDRSLRETDMDAVKKLLNLATLSKKSESNPTSNISTPKVSMQKGGFRFEFLKDKRIDVKKLPEDLKQRFYTDASYMKEIKTQIKYAFDSIDAGDLKMEGSKKMIVQRILGFKDICPNSEKWSIETGQEAQCWKCNQWMFAIVLYNKPIRELGRKEMKQGLTNPRIDLEPFKRVADIELADMQNQDEKQKKELRPLVYTEQSDWKAQEMMPMREFCQKIDYKKPDFVKYMVENELCRSRIKDVAQFDEEEQGIYDGLVQAYDNGYETNYVEVFEKNLIYKQPYLINIEKQEELNAGHKLYCHAMFIRPGKFHYIVGQDDTGKKDKPPEKVQSKAKQELLKNQFVLKMGEGFRRSGAIKKQNPLLQQMKMKIKSQIQEKKADAVAKLAPTATENVAYKRDFVQFTGICELRAEEVPEKEATILKKKKIKKFVRESTIFADFRIDNDLMLDKCYKLDNKEWKINRLTKSEEDLANTLKAVRQYYPLLKEIFIFVAAQSKYPHITQMDFSRFLQSANVLDHNLDIATMDRVFISSNLPPMGVDESKRDADYNPQNALCRYEFVEAMVRCAQSKYYFPTQAKRGGRKLTLTQATEKFLQQLSDNLFEVLYNPQQFREEKLWNHDCANLFKKHEEALRDVAKFYVERNKKQEGQYNHLTLANMRELFCEHTSLQLKERDVIFLYAHSKITNADELSDQSPFRYNRLRFVEFIEMIAHVAEFQFKGSELEEYELAKKIEFILTEIFKVIGYNESQDNEKKKQKAKEKKERNQENRKEKRGAAARESVYKNEGKRRLGPEDVGEGSSSSSSSEESELTEGSHKSTSEDEGDVIEEEGTVEDDD